ncbi:MAG TPA: hypothetical protein VH370_13620 [Humisphaera sp.]|jgi:hypothetical protein|nr:hypothetical protein [Humisphaera sp.]
MTLPRRLRLYLANLSAGRLILWCYFIWYLLVLVRYFDPRWRIWATSFGLSLIIGAALLINTTLSGKVRLKLEHWPTFRLFVTPFCVSSFAALVKEQHFILIFSPNRHESFAGAGLIAAFCAIVWIAKRSILRPPTTHHPQPTTHQ